MSPFRFLLLVLALAVPAVHAQPVPPIPPVPPVPPALPLDPAMLDTYFTRPPKVEVNLSGPLLRMAAGVTASNDPVSAEMIRALRGISVRVYPMAAARADLALQIAGVGQQLTAQGWHTMVRVRPDEDDTSDVSIFVRALGDGGLDGMVVMALDADDGDAAFVFIDGPLDAAQLGRLSDRFAGTRLEAQERAREAEVRAYEAEERARAAEERARDAEQRRQR